MSRIIRFSLLTIAVLLIPTVLTAAGIDFPGAKSSWNGFDKYDFKLACGEFGERPCTVVCPKEPAEGNPWIWRAVFFGHEPQTEIAMLNNGYYVAFISCTDLVGSPQRVAQCNCLYKFLTEKGLNKKTNLLGMSRGGISSMNWAIANPDCVRSIYIDNPVLDFKTWPGAILGNLNRWEGDWQSVLNSYGFKNDDEAKAYKGNPVDAYGPLAERKVPILLMCGTADKVVPFEFNGQPLFERYKAAGGIVKLVKKPGHDHHPHSLKDPKLIVDFYLNPPTECSEMETTYQGN